MAEGRDASTSDSITDSFPLLESSAESNNGLSGTYERPSTASRRAISRAFNLIRRTSGRRMMREPSVLVRETAAEHLEERQNEWAYSKPIVILDLIWNLTFVIVASVVLLMSIDEKPSHPLRIWILGYALQCCIHVACVWFEYSRRLSTSGRRTYDPEAPSYSSSQDDLSYSRSYSEQEFNQDYERVVASRVSLAKRIESANTSLSFIWWVLGFYWATTEDQSQNAPLLFWLCAAFLAFDVFFVVFCVSLACIIGVAVCCCLPCILAVMHRMAEQVVQ
ncbi:hypothetical protein KP509_27G035500 [Ceratopteris richardii]|uniref:RING-type E3 ubiquitin transferase n=1 Tax=Ceratopteris richardii TaxID=49495 RepID=A0A8T2RGY3_CERRI|nr:hypothetical protein KP509_27G035500 [Ceratopteris richardii]